MHSTGRYDGDFQVAALAGQATPYEAGAALPGGPYTPGDA